MLQIAGVTQSKSIDLRGIQGIMVVQLQEINFNRPEDS